MALSYFPNPEQIKNERESLERIHTFSLKEPIDFNASDDQINGAQIITGNFLDPLKGQSLGKKYDAMWIALACQISLSLRL